MLVRWNTVHWITNASVMGSLKHQGSNMFPDINRVIDH
jgi:hypothetical protein